MKTTRLEIRDEVNVRFHDLDPQTRTTMKKAVEFVLPHARHTPAFKLGRWDGKMSYCDIGGRTYFHLLDRILPIVMNNGYEIEIEDLRVKETFTITPVCETDYNHVNWPSGHPLAGQPVILRDYQVDVINRFFENPQCIQQIATGAGKTLMTAVLSHRCEAYGRTIVIVPSKDLVVQTERDYRNLGLDVGVLYGDRKEYTRTHTICTWQSLEVLNKKTKNKVAEVDIDVFLKDVVCVMCDETHKAKADILRQMLTGVFANVPIRWGLTGTVPKAEYELLSCVSCIGPVVGSLSSKELQDAGVLSNLDIDVLQLIDSPRAFSNYAQELKWLTTDCHRLDHISDLIGNLDGNTLVLIDRLVTGEELLRRNPDWVFISGKMKTSDRQEEYAEISDSDGKVIVATYGVAAVGINIPRIFNLVMIEPGKSFVRVIQSIGRGIRRAQDKDYVKILDITSDLKYSKRHLTERKRYYAEQQFPFKVTKVKYQ